MINHKMIFERKILPGAMKFSDGSISVPMRPGPGLDLDEAMLKPWLDNGSDTLSVVYQR